MIKIGKYIYIIYYIYDIRPWLKAVIANILEVFLLYFRMTMSHGMLHMEKWILSLYIWKSRVPRNNVRVSLLIGIQVIPLDWNSSASLCFNMTGLSYWLLGKQSEKTTQQHEYLHLRLCLTKRTVCSVVYLHQDSFDNNKRCGLQKLPTCVPGRLSARHGWVNMITAVAHINI